MRLCYSVLLRFVKQKACPYTGKTFCALECSVENIIHRRSLFDISDGGGG